VGYSITIGNAVPMHSKDEYGLYAGWEVGGEAHDGAPVFPNDDMTGNSNGRSPSYTAWSESMRALGLYALFFDDVEDEGLFRPHPGCALLTSEIAERITTAVAAYRATTTKPAGCSGWKLVDGHPVYPDEGKYDDVLMRGEWLAYWVNWAVANCKTPAIQNT
jgi:hypothetical protein